MPIAAPIPPPPAPHLGVPHVPMTDSSSDREQNNDPPIPPAGGAPDSSSSIDDESQRTLHQPIKRQSKRIRARQNEEQASSSTIPRRVSFSTKIRRRHYSPSAKAATREYQPRDQSQSSSSTANTTREQKHDQITSSFQRNRNTNTPTRDTKLDQVRASILRHQQGTSRPHYTQETNSSRNRRSRSPEINALRTKVKAKIIKFKGNIHNMRTALAHCVPSNSTHYTKLNSQLARNHPYAGFEPINHLNLPIGSVITNFDPENHKFFFTLVTKNCLHDTASYYALSLALATLKTTLEHYNIKELVLPKVGKGLDYLRERTALRLIFDKFQNTPITIYYQN